MVILGRVQADVEIDGESLHVRPVAGIAPTRPQWEYRECLHSEFVFVRRVQSNGVHIACRQCLTCGKNVGAARKDSFPDYAALPEWDQTLRDRWLAEQRQRYDEYRIGVQDWHAQQGPDWQGAYETYLQSSTWAVKRAAVLKRDDYICQACLTARATQVHHLTYEHLGNEPLWELVAICRRCHKALHGKEVNL
jgi:5-methylcytosine-specific restriction endonuclease McrA